MSLRRSSTCAQPQPPSVREILGAYRMKGEGDREMLLAILQAKTAEDQVRLATTYLLSSTLLFHVLLQRIAATTKLHQTLLQFNCAPPDDVAPGNHREQVERPIVHPKFNGTPSPSTRPTSSSSSSFHYHARATSRHSVEERRHSNGWTVLSPPSGTESVGEDLIYQSPRSVKDDINVNATTHSHSHSPTDSPLETNLPRATGGDRVMSIGTLLSAPEPLNTSHERRGAGGQGMDVDEEEQARRGRKYDER